MRIFECNKLCNMLSYCVVHVSGFKAADPRRRNLFDGCCLSLHEWMTYIVKWSVNAESGRTIQHCTL